MLEFPLLMISPSPILASANVFGGEMLCKKCASTRQQNFSGELAVAFSGIERIGHSPVYICQKVLVCLDCGYAELVIPATELEKLRKGIEGFHSKGA
jgi:hypothetical protein